MERDILVAGTSIKLYDEVKRGIVNPMGGICYTSEIQEAVYRVGAHDYCMVILDMALPDNRAGQAVAAIREKSPVPILVLLDKARVSDKVSVLKKGADNILEKPCPTEMLLAQMEALLRRYTELNHITYNGGDIICYGGLVLDIGRREVSIDGKEILLPCKEYEILLYMLKNRWRTLTSEQIYEAVWKEAYLDDKSVIFYHMGQLRRLMGEGWIETVYGVGYRLYNKVGKQRDISEKP